jgi:multidrug efflux pump subunit AcrA (membrane-fusion protein)
MKGTPGGTKSPEPGLETHYLLSRQLQRVPNLLARGVIYLTILLFTAGLLFTALVRTDIVVSGPGVIRGVARTVEVYSGASGRVRNVLVEEWQAVSADTGLYLVESDSGEESIVRSGTDGIVSRLLVTETGSRVDGRSPLCVIREKPDRYIAEATVANRDIGAIGVGTEAALRVAALAASLPRPLAARVRAIAPGASSDGTYLVRAEIEPLDNAAAGGTVLRDGMLAVVDFKIGRATILSQLVGGRFRRR